MFARAPGLDSGSFDLTARFESRISSTLVVGRFLSRFAVELPAGVDFLATNAWRRALRFLAEALSRFAVACLRNGLSSTNASSSSRAATARANASASPNLRIEKFFVRFRPSLSLMRACQLPPGRCFGFVNSTPGTPLLLLERFRQ